MAIDKSRLPWDFLNSYRGNVFQGEWPTIIEMLFITQQRFGTHSAFTDFSGPNGEKRSLSYFEVYEHISAIGSWMNSQGIKPGDHIAVSGKNSPEWALIFLSVLYAGATVIPIDFGLKKKERDNLLKTATPKMFFLENEKLSEYIFEKTDYELFPLTREWINEVLEQRENFTNSRPFYKQEPDSVAAILFTSGTTGNPKGVMLTNENFVSDCYIAQTNFNISEKDIFYALLPIHHAYTLQAVFIESLSVGAEIVFGKSLAVSQLMKELRQGQITMFLGVPLLFNKLLAGIMNGVKEKGKLLYVIIRFLMKISYLIKKITGKPVGKKMFKTLLKKANIYTIRTAISGGGPLSEKVFKDYQALGVDFIQGYGLTETSPIVALNPSEHFKIESVGRNFKPYMDMKIDNPDEDGVGEILIRGPMVMKGYYNMPEETAKVIDSDGWFHTGDLGRLDSEDYLILCGRSKNIIVTDGGKNVYPEEIENAFQMCNEIQQITVKGYVEEKNEKVEKIEALIYPSDYAYENVDFGVRGNEDSDKAVKQKIHEEVNKVNKNLLSYQRITKITILDEPLEMTTSQKVIRKYNK